LYFLFPFVFNVVHHLYAYVTVLIFTLTSIVCALVLLMNLFPFLFFCVEAYMKLCFLKYNYL